MKPLVRLSPSLLTALFLLSCAGQAPPPGGPEDYIPPQIVSVYPAPYATFYDDNRIVLEFDEFVNRNSVNESIFISPHIGDLEFDWSGKEVEIGFEGVLRENTTYVVNVGTDVRDLNRGNRMAQSFTLAFSTGPAIDRGAVEGRVYPALRGEEIAGVMMFAYRLDGIDRDTLNPKTTEPDYITQTGSDGGFFLRHLSLGWYRIVAVRDQYRNFVYDPETDDYGLLQRDIHITESDTLVAGLEIRLAKEDTTAPRLVKVNPVNGQLLTVEFSEALDTAGMAAWSIEVVDTVSGDEIPVLAMAPQLPKRTALVIATGKQEGGKVYSVSVANVRDSVGHLISPIANSLVFEGSGTPDTAAPFLGSLTFRDSAKGLAIDPVLGVFFDEPVQSVPWDSVVSLRDSVGRTLALEGRWAGSAAIEVKPTAMLGGNAWYRLNVNSRVLVDEAGNRGKDTLWSFKFETLDPERLSGIEGRVVSEGSYDTAGPVIIQAYNTGQKTVSGTQEIREGGPFTFRSLLEGQYILEAFRDRVRNRLYDPGNVFPFHPSERFTVHRDTLRLRARWPVEGVKVELK
ncbi:MAG TPA: Ig-like domain-containing protein [Bacteroidota bacterium]